MTFGLSVSPDVVDVWVGEGHRGGVGGVGSGNLWNLTRGREQGGGVVRRCLGAATTLDLWARAQFARAVGRPSGPRLEYS